MLHASVGYLNEEFFAKLILVIDIDSRSTVSVLS
jgi:hypothetical protein